MGTPGVPFNVSKQRILECIKAKKGVLSQVSKELGYAHETMLKHINRDPELVEALSDARNSWEEQGLDIAENYVMGCMGQLEDRSTGLRSAIYFLNNKGRKRGYTPPTVNPDQGKQEASVIDTLLSGFRQLHASQSKEQSTGHGETPGCDAPVPVVPDSTQ